MAWPRDVINIYRRGGPLAEAIPLVKSQTCPDKASKILLPFTPGALSSGSGRRRSLDRPCSPHRHHSPPPRSPPPERRHSPHRPPDRLAPASRQKRGHIDDDVDSNQFEEVVNTHERVPVVKWARDLPEKAGLHSADDDHRQREDGHRSRKEQHREYTRR
ncbi:hypothetical protein PAXINDRAFT_13059 [Paxillus involutus ATCC 200175]|uniref:Uncharacterized protein n=1 Tax=Paxillus involutus ATCC 200175 TaxID=664439 RepID=A0A0C9TV63_PAXIN|nr:hypothetical protein PAXINDRAFT_13059 [Paxillus involutus ATCC 200175]